MKEHILVLILGLNAALFIVYTVQLAVQEFLEEVSVFYCFCFWKWALCLFWGLCGEFSFFVGGGRRG